MCDGDEVVTNCSSPEGQQNWLQKKKAKKAASSAFCSLATMGEEFDKYCAESCEPEQSNPFLWWAGNKTKYPNVAAVSRQYLSVPATSVASERIFSKCGLICSERRAALTPEHVEQLVFLSQNLDRK